MSISDLVSKIGGTEKTPSLPTKKTVGISGLLSQMSGEAPVETKMIPDRVAPVVEQAVAQTYPVARPEPQEPKSLFQRYGDWSVKTGKAISESTAAKGVARGFAGLWQITQGLSGLGYNALGLDEAAKNNFETYTKIGKFTEEHFAPEIGTYRNVDSLSDAGTYAVEKVTENLAMFIPSMATGGMGGIAARTIAEKTVKQKVGQLVASGVEKKLAEEMIAKEIVKKVTLGSGIGAGASTIGMETGSIAGDIYQETGRIEGGTALIGGIPAGLLDVAPQIGILKRLFGSVGDEVVKSLVKKIGANGAKQVLQEGGTEMAQTLIEIGAVSFESGKPVFSRETLDQIIDAGLGGGIAGGGLSVGTDVYTAMRNAKSVSQIAQETKLEQGFQQKRNEAKRQLEENGLGEDIRNSLETNGEEETMAELVAQFGADESQASRLISLAVAPTIPTEEEAAQQAQKAYEEMQGEQKLASEGTETIIPKVNALIEKVSEYSGDIKDLEDELQQLQKMRQELEKRTEPEAQVAKEAILLLPAPKEMKLLPVPKDIESGDTVKIKTNITGVERNAEVVEVREDSVVAIVKGDAHFPETPMVFPVEHFTAKPHVPKVTDLTYAEWKKREAEKRARHAKEQAEKVPGLREKAKKAEKTPAISAVFTKEADKIEGKKIEKKPKETSSTTKEERTDAAVKAEAWRRGDKYSVVYEFKGTTVQKRGFKTEEDANAWINNNATRSEHGQKIYEMVSKIRETPQKPIEKIEKEKSPSLSKISKEEEDHLFAKKPVKKEKKVFIDTTPDRIATVTEKTSEELPKQKNRKSRRLTDNEAYDIAYAEWRSELEKGKEAYSLYNYHSTLEFAMNHISDDSAEIIDMQKRAWEMYRNNIGTKEDRIALMLEILRKRKILMDETDRNDHVEDLSDPVPEPKQVTINDFMSSHDAVITRLNEGNITPKELQDAFGNMVARESDIMEWLNKMTIAELRKKFGGYPRRDDTKKDVVKSSYRNLLELYAPSDSITYHAFSESYSEAVARYVNSATEETIAEYAKRVAERRAEREAWMKDKIQAIKDPQTLDQFRTFIEANGADKMTDEQRIRYDNLVAEKIKADTEKKIQQKALVKGVDAGVGFEIHQTKHTKTGADLYVVTMGARVEKDVYSQLNATAKKLGGYYSSFRGAGAIPGFQFKTPEDAQSFMKAGQGETVDTTEKITDKKEAQKSKTTNKLALLAEQLEERATEKLNQDRKTNTAKRAREASGAEADARADIQMAQTMKNLAGAIASGRAKFLDGITAKTHIEEMESALRQAKWKQEKLVETQYRMDHKDATGPDGYLTWEANKEIRRLKEEVQNGPVTDQTISALDDIFPTFIGGNLVTDILEPASKKKGYKLLANRYMKIIPKGDKRWTPTSFQQVNDLADMMKQVDATGMYAYPIERTQRLQRMGVTSTPQFRAMLREYVTFRGDAVEADKATELERALVGSKVGFDFFPTPRTVADQMVQEAGITAGMKVLEPSAGNGNIAEAIRDAGSTPEVIELSSQLREILEAKGFTVVGQDFLEHTEGGYDAIIQNPPFSNNADIAHVKHAYDLLAPGGKLVSIVGEGAFFRSGKTETEFRDWLDAHEATVEQLPAGTFEDKTLMATTGANGRIVVIEKPKVDFMVRDSLGRFATEEMASSVVQVVSGRYKTYFRIPQDRFEEMKNLVDTPDTEIASQINAMSGAMYHLTAKSPAQMEAEGFEDGGWITPEILLRETVPDFRTADTLTTKILESLGTRESVSKQFIIDATKQQGVSGPERGLILDILEGEGDKVNVQDFKNKVKTELLPLEINRRSKDRWPSSNWQGYENVSLSENLRGSVANYHERIYESPINTSAGEVHFPGDTENYFAHTRIEDMADPSLLDEDGEPVDIEEMTPQQRKLVEKNGGVGTTRRVIEIQSDLFQKGRLEKEVNDMWNYAEPDDNGAIAALKASATAKSNREKELAPLQPYRNTWQERIIREEVAQAALDGKTKLQFPTGETAMKIEGLGQENNWMLSVDGETGEDLSPSHLKRGLEITTEDRAELSDDEIWVVTQVLGDGKFYAINKESLVTREKIEEVGNDVEDYEELDGKYYIEDMDELFDISDSLDKGNPIYKFYEKEVAKYLRNKYGAKLVTDAQGVTWNEITITPDMKGPVLAFRSQDIEDRLEERLAGPLVDENESRRILAEFTDRLRYEIPVQFLDKILTGEKVPALFSMSEKWQRAWGVTYKGVFGFEKLIPAHTIPHEIIHFTINNLDQMADDFGVTRMELLTAANDGKMPLSAKEEAEIGERIARRFERVWKQSEQGKAHTEKGIVGQFFDKLVDFIKRILQIKPSDVEILRNFYDKVLYMRRTGPVIRGARANLSRFEVAPGVVNFKEGEFMKKEDPLIAEAKKYNTFDEFVKAQGTPVYRGARTPELKETSGDLGTGFYFTKDNGLAKIYAKNTGMVHEYVIDPRAKIVDQSKIPYGVNREEWATQNGYDGISYKQGSYADTAEFKDSENILIYNKDVIKTRSQLTDIWKKAHSGADDLVTQAKKYETAEEFVKAQGTPLYHGSTNKWTGEFRKPTGERGSEGIFLSPSESGAKYYDRSLDGSGEVKSVFVNPKVKLWDYKNPKDVEALSAYIKSTVENTSQRTLKLKLEAQKDAIIQRAKMSEGGMQIRGADLPKYNEIKQKLSELPDSAYNKSADELIAEIKTGAYETISDPRISSWIKQHYDGFKQMDWYDTGRAESIAIFDPKNVQTRSQLTDIWKKANETPDFKAKDEIVSTEKEFYSKYTAQHKLIRSTADLESIQKNGFKKSSFPNTMSVYRGGEPTNIIQKRYAPKKGDVILLIPKDQIVKGPNGDSVKEGFKPTDKEVVTIAYDNQSMFEAYVNAHESVDFKAKDNITMDMFDAMSEEEQREVIAMEAAEDLRGYGTLSPIEELAESLLNGSQKVSIRTDIKNDIRETLGKSLYMRMFRKDAVESWDELVDDLRRATGDASYTGNDLVSVVIARDKARKLAAQEHAVARRQARLERAEQVKEAKTEADKIKLIRDIEKDITRKLLAKKYTIKQYIAAIERSRKEGFKKGVRTQGDRAKRVNAIAEIHGLTDAQVRRVLHGRDFRIMTDSAFEDFIVELEQMKEIILEHSEAMVQLQGVIHEKGLVHVENLQAALDMPRQYSEMTTKQLRELEAILSKYEVGDVFLGTRTLETIDRTDLAGIRTYREAKMRLAKETGVPFSELEKIKVGELDRFRWDAILREQNVFYRMLVDTLNHAFLKGDSRTITIEKQINALIKAARKSRMQRMTLGEKIRATFITTDNFIFDWLEGDEMKKEELAKEMTREEMAAALFVQEYFVSARDYLVAQEMMKKYREDYITHIRRGFLEAWRESGLKVAVEEVMKSRQEDQASFTILDKKTGQILPIEKFFGFALRRVGEIKPTKNVATAVLGYARQFERKKEYDAILPKIHAYTRALTPLETTKEGVVMDDSLKTFVNTWVNSKKGRRAEPMWSPGGKIDWVIHAIDTFLTIKFLGFNVASGLTSHVGEFMGTYYTLGEKKTALGIGRLATPKGRAFVAKYEEFVGRTPWDSLHEMTKSMPEKLFEFGLMGLFKSGSVRANKIHLLGSLTKEEWESGEVSPERLTEMKVELGRWRVVEGAESIMGKTTFGSVVKRFKSWAYVMGNRASKDIASSVKMLRNGDVKETMQSREFRELVRIGITGALIYIIALNMLDDEDWEYKKGETFLEELRRKGLRDAFSPFQSMTPATFLSAPVMLDWLVNLGKSIDSLIKMEEYKSSKKGQYKKGDLKAIPELKRLIIPSVLQ